MTVDASRGVAFSDSKKERLSMTGGFTKEQQQLRDSARQIAAQVAGLIEEPLRAREFPWAAVRLMQDGGLLHLRVPREHGGQDSDIVGLCLAQHELARVDVGLSNFISDQNVPVHLLGIHGSDEQKRRFFRKTVAEKGLWCVAATEPHGGSDFAGMRTTAVRNGSHYVLNGQKTWASTGGPAQMYVVFANTDPAKKMNGISAFIVERDTPGFAVGREIPKLGWHTMSTTDLTFENVEVPVENRIGQEGDGFPVFLSALVPGRLGIAAQALGAMQAAFEYARDYTKLRKQFGRAVADFQAVRFMLADMATNIEVSESFVYRTARVADSGGEDLGKLAAMAKYFVSDVAMKTAIDALQLLGAPGYCSDHPLERIMRDAKGLQIADGTNQIMRIVVAKEVLG
jgi:alkylation response protein AidB-like acyl-CoA dehydrogenase